MKEESTTKAEASKVESIPGKKSKKFGKPIHDILEGDYLSKEAVISSLPYILFVAILALIYISNTYYSEKTLKDIERTKGQLKELRFQYITTKSTLMYYGKQTEIARRAAKFGLKETIIPPYKIFYSNDSTLAFMKSGN